MSARWVAATVAAVAIVIGLVIGLSPFSARAGARCGPPLAGAEPRIEARRTSNPGSGIDWGAVGDRDRRQFAADTCDAHGGDTRRITSLSLLGAGVVVGVVAVASRRATRAAQSPPA